MLHLAICQDNYNEQIDMWSVGCIYAELLQMLATSSKMHDAICTATLPRKELIMRTLQSGFQTLTQLANCDQLQDRGPLFPGSSCYPLSPDRKHRKDPRFHTFLGSDL